jgi:methionine-S-sulfoxide reductase
MRLITILVLSLLIPLKEAKSMSKETATLAGGCFWGMEEIISSIPGVISTQVGYTGGEVDNPTYGIVKLGQSNHAEAVQVIFDPNKLSFKDLLGYFFRMHDPTTPNQQGNDRGSQYRSAVFYHSELQQQMARAVMLEIETAKKWPRPLVTQVEPAGRFYPAEEYHQKYLKKNPNGYTCHWLRN